MEKMLAAVFEDVGKLELKMVPVPQIQREDQVLVEVEAVSICGTDVHIKIGRASCRERVCGMV